MICTSCGKKVPFKEIMIIEKSDGMKSVCQPCYKKLEQSGRKFSDKSLAIIGWNNGWKMDSVHNSVDEAKARMDKISEAYEPKNLLATIRVSSKVLSKIYSSSGPGRGKYLAWLFKNRPHWRF